MPIETIHYLEMTAPGQLRPAAKRAGELELRKVGRPYPELNRFLYTAVGGDWYWVDRLSWSYAEWERFLARPGHQTWIAYNDGTPAGYFELDVQGHGDPAGADVEIASFGLLPQFVGQGLGGGFLTRAIEIAWSTPARRVWLHTCSNDHPRALANYQARGFVIYKVEHDEKELPATTPGPWPNSGSTRGS